MVLRTNAATSSQNKNLAKHMQTHKKEHKRRTWKHQHGLHIRASCNHMFPCVVVCAQPAMLLMFCWRSTFSQITVVSSGAFHGYEPCGSGPNVGADTIPTMCSPHWARLCLDIVSEDAPSIHHTFHSLRYRSKSSEPCHMRRSGTPYRSPCNSWSLRAATGGMW